MQLVDHCPVCGSNRWAPYARSGMHPGMLHYAQVRCRSCGMIASQPQATKEETDAYYANSYYQKHWPDPELIWRSNLPAYEACELPLMETMSVNIAQGSGKRVAEIGCGYGSMLMLLRDRGFTVTGCDLSEVALEACRKQGLAVARGGIPGVPFATNSFDLVIATHVIEHLADPRVLIDEMSSLLRVGGRMVIVTEDATASQDAFERGLARMSGKLPAFRTSTDHTFLFGPSQLEKLCAHPALDNVRVKSFSRPPGDESMHWKLYKGAFRVADKLRHRGEFLMAVATRRRGSVAQKA